MTGNINIFNEPLTTNWSPIDTHPKDDKACLLAEFAADGSLMTADVGGWNEGETREEWDEVDDGVMVKLWEDEEEGCWWSNHEIINDPSHWAPLNQSEEQS